ncbi:MAG: PAS domain S-box protein [Syntrophorhabdaceae bacterium]|nr:PAS domain S-box protein [Syntrophorhabdaceae bacterium]
MANDIDINSRLKKVEEQLKDREEQYRLIVDTADEGIWVFDENYITTYANRRMADMLGYNLEELQGKCLKDFIHEEDIPNYEMEVARRKRGLSGRYERMLRKKDGSYMWALVSATPILDKDKRFIGSFAMFTDITDKKNAEEALKKSEEKYRSIFENAVEGIFQSTPDGRLITVNPTMARIFGFTSPEEMIDRVVNIGKQLYTSSEDRHRFKKILEEKGMVERFEAQFFRKDGTVLWGSLNVRAVKDRDGTIKYYEGTLEDITSRKKAEEELKRSEEKYRDIFENAVEGIFQVTPDGRYLSVNPALAKIHGFSSPEEMMASVTDIAHQLYVDPSRRAELKRRIERDGYVKDFEILMRKKDASLQWVSITSHAVKDKNGNTLYYEGMLVDITSRKLAEEEAQKYKKSLNGMIDILYRVIETKDPGIKGHHKRVSKLAMAIAEEMGFTKDNVEIIGIASIIHDVGKTKIPTEILIKPDRLNDMEYSLIKTHPEAGYEMIKDSGLPAPIGEIVLQHHERLDGSGYPKGLKGLNILIEACILAVADVVEAMSSKRPYREALTLDSIILELKNGKGTKYHPDVIDTCIDLFEKKRFMFY